VIRIERQVPKQLAVLDGDDTDIAIDDEHHHRTAPLTDVGVLKASTDDLLKAVDLKIFKVLSTELKK